MARSRIQTNRSSVSRARPAAGSRDPGELFVNWPDKQLITIDAAKNPIDLIGVRFFSATAQYNTDEMVVQAGRLYRCLSPTGPGSFVPASWQILGEVFEAPNDGKIYGRQSVGWSETVTKVVYDADISGAAAAIVALQSRMTGAEGVNTAQDAALALKAPLASPALTGTPTAPTPAALDNTTKISTTAFVIGELTSFSVQVNAALALKAPLASPVFTGDARAVTPALGDNDTSIPTTAWVKALAYLQDAPSDGFTYGRKNGAWSTVVGGAVISDAAPGGSLQAGQLWWESDSGKLYIYYNDGNTNQWVETGGQNVGQTLLPSTVQLKTADSRNHIVNPSMQISQEWGDSGSNTSGSFPADQWALGAIGITGIGGQRNHPSAPNPPNALMIGFSTAKPSLAAGDLASLYQPIEGSRVADFGWGFAGAKQVVLDFKVAASTAGTFAVSIVNAAGTRSWLGSYTIAPGEVNTFVRRTMVIPGDVTGAWAVADVLGMSLMFHFAAGSSWIGVPGWQAGDKRGLPGMSNGAAVTTNYTITDVGLYLDPNNTGLAPSFQMPEYSEQLKLCQRYYANQYANGQQGAVSAYLIVPVYFQNEMRTTPAVNNRSPGTVTNASAVAISGTSPLGAWLQFSSTSSGNGSVLNRIDAYSARL